MRIIRDTRTPICYIECPPSSVYVGHMRWADHDMNHIYKEVSDDVGDYSSGFRPLTEKNLSRISKGHEKDGYIIISASRDIYSNSENDVRTKQLRDYLKKSNYSYIPLYGGYKELGADKASFEKSFIVYPYDVINHKTVDFNKFKQDLIDVASPPDEPNNLHFDQDAILVCEPGGKPYYVGLKSGVDDSGIFDEVEYNNTDSEFFTAIKKWNDSSLNRKKHTWDKGKPQRFTFKNSGGGASEDN